MITGRETLQELARATGEAKRRVDALDQRLASANDRVVELDAAFAASLRELAKTRLGGLAAGTITERLDEADGKTLALLERRREQIADLERRRETVDRRVRDLDVVRIAAADAVERAAAAVDVAEAGTQRRLADDPAYQARLVAAEHAERIAVHADQKASLAEAERESKGKAYRDDPLFLYLWERGFGTPTYRPGGGPLAGLFRWLDGKVATIVRYDRARADYARLQELPLRLREHADRVGVIADEAVAEVERMESVARTEDGIPSLDAAVERAEAEYAAANAAVAKGEAERDALEAEMASFAAGDDETMQDITRFLRSELGREDLQALRRDALATPFPEDDAIVADLLDLDDERARHAATVQELKQAALRARERLDELRTLQATFKRERYDAPGSSFPDRDVISTLLAEIVAGSVRGASLWQVLERQRRFRPPSSDPMFGSGRLGGGRAWTGGGVAGQPRGRAGHGGGGLGSLAGTFGATKRAQGRMRSGGFKTGGRF